MILIDDGRLAVIEHGLDRAISRWAERSGDLSAYDPRIRQTLCPLIPEGGVVVDGGAYIGDHTLPFAERVGPSGDVWAFEIYLPALQCLYYNTQDLPQVHVVPSALAQERATFQLMINHMVGSCTQLHQPNEDGVPAVPLDLFTFPRLDFVKLDLEGYELKALRGAEATLRQHRPIVVTESGVLLKRYGDSHEALMAFMEDLGYAGEQLPLLHPGGDVFDMLFRPTVH